MLGLPSKEPAWSPSLAGVMHSNCFDAAEDADVATCVAVLNQLLLRMQQVSAPHMHNLSMCTILYLETDIRSLCYLSCTSLVHQCFSQHVT